MKLRSYICLQILAFDTTVAGGAHRSVEFVVMMFAVRRVVEDVELCSREGIAASFANKALLVVPSGKAT
jgi:hypothetical protein